MKTQRELLKQAADLFDRFVGLAVSGSYFTYPLGSLQEIEEFQAAYKELSPLPVEGKVRVKIAVAVDSDGSVGSSCVIEGKSDDPDIDDDGLAIYNAMGHVHEHVPVAIYFLEADLDKPKASTIEAVVTDLNG